MPHPEDLDVPDATPTAGFACPDLTTFCRLDELGLVVTGQRLEPDLTWTDREARFAGLSLSSSDVQSKATSLAVAVPLRIHGITDHLRPLRG